jgi:hypothetical protein
MAVTTTGAVILLLWAGAAAETARTGADQCAFTHAACAPDDEAAGQQSHHHQQPSTALKTDDKGDNGNDGDVATCRPDPVFEPKLLNHSWATLPTFWQGSPEELQTAAQIEQATEFSMVTVTHHHGTVAEAVDACRRVKLAKPNCSCVMYFDVQLVVNDSAIGAALNPLNGSHRAWLLRDATGQLMLPAGKFLTPDYRIEDAGSWFLSGCANATRSAFVDGCNLDGGNEFWYAYSAFLRHDSHFSTNDQASYIAAFRSSLQQLQRTVPNKVLFLHCEQCVIPPSSSERAVTRSPCIPPAWCGEKGKGSALGMSGQAIEDFFPSQEFVDIVRYMAACGKWFKAYVDPVSSNGRASCADVAQRGALLAAWLVAVGEGHYFLCGVEGAAQPLPEFRLPLGAPKGPAVPLQTGGGVVGLTREFSSGTKALWVPGANFTARGAGCVRWASGQVTGVCPVQDPSDLPGSMQVETDDMMPSLRIPSIKMDDGDDDEATRTGDSVPVPAATVVRDWRRPEARTATHPNMHRMVHNASKTVPILYKWNAFESGAPFWNGTALVAVGSGRVQVDNDSTPWGGPADAFLWCELKWASNSSSSRLSLTASSEDVGLFGGVGPSVTCEGSAGCCSVVADSSGPCPSCGMCCFVD